MAKSAPTQKTSSQHLKRSSKSVNLLITGNHNTTQVSYSDPSVRQPTIEELIALQNVLYAQTELIRIYQKRKT